MKFFDGISSKLSSSGVDMSLPEDTLYASLVGFLTLLFETGLVFSNMLMKTTYTQNENFYHKDLLPHA